MIKIKDYQVQNDVNKITTRSGTTRIKLLPGLDDFNKMTTRSGMIKIK